MVGITPPSSDSGSQNCSGYNMHGAKCRNFHRKIEAGNKGWKSRQEYSHEDDTSQDVSTSGGEMTQEIEGKREEKKEKCGNVKRNKKKV